MTFEEVLGQVLELLQREKRVSYRGLKRRFAVDDEYLEDLKELSPVRHGCYRNRLCAEGSCCGLSSEDRGRQR